MHRRRISPLNQATRLSSREEHAMKKWQCIWTAMFLALALGVGWAQGDSGQQPADSTQPPAASASPAPAFGQDNPPPQTDDNPPLSGLDSPSLEPRTAARSFLVPGANVSQSVDSNVGGTLVRFAELPAPWEASCCRECGGTMKQIWIIRVARRFTPDSAGAATRFTNWRVSNGSCGVQVS